MRSGLFLATMLAASSLAAAEMPLTIDQLLAQGWEIAGCASGYDNRTSLILFRHPGVNALVQCGILYACRAQSSIVTSCGKAGTPRKRRTAIQLQSPHALVGKPPAAHARLTPLTVHNWMETHAHQSQSGVPRVESKRHIGMISSAIASNPGNNCGTTCRNFSTSHFDRSISNS